jgi:acyl-CoA synthetase (NDP forming)
VAGEGYDVAAFARDAAAFASQTGKPVVVAAPQETVASQFTSAGTIVFANQTDAIAALAQLASHTELLRQRRLEGWPSLTVDFPAGDAPLLNEAESLNLLASNGMPVTPYELCRSIDGTRAAFERFGSYVAIKACSPDLPHKSDLGLVMLGIASAAAAAEAFTELTARMAAARARNDGVIVAPMAAARREMALGARIDPVFGPVVMVSDGGRYVEALPDVALLLPPFGADSARAAWRSLRMAPLFDGVRGEPALDLDALCDATVRLGQIIAGASDRIASIDANPIMVRAAGHGVVIVDALVERASRR